MKKFTGTLVSFVFVFFLATSNLWAGDSEIRTGPEDQQTPSLPLIMSGSELTDEVPPEAEPTPPAPAAEEDMTEMEEAVEEVDQATETAAESVEETADKTVEMADEATEEAVEMADDAAETVEEVVAAEPPPAPKDDLTIAAELLEKEGLENYKKALELCEAAVKKDPDSFKANWMAAKACRLYGMEAQEQGLSGWKDICKRYGKKGMAYAEKAKELEPNKPHGHYWYGMNVGIYADSVSILTALKEGLKDKTQNSFETAYKIDKYYEDAGPIAALGRFWAVLPWPLNDKDKSMEYFREYQKTKFFGQEDNVQVNVYFAELLMDSRKTKDEAIEMLKQVPRISSNKYWNDQAEQLLSEM